MIRWNHKEALGQVRNKGAIAAICFIMILGVLFTAATRRFVSERVGDGLLTAKSAQSGGFAAAESAQSGAFAAAQAAQNGISAAESERSGSPAAGGPFGAQAEANAAPAAAEDRAAAEARMEAGEAGKAAAEDGMAAGEPGKAAAGDTAEAPAAAPAETSVLQEADGKAAGDGSAIISPLSGAAPGTAAAGIRTEEEFRRRLEEVDELVESRRDSDAAATAESLRRQADYEFRLWEEERSRIVQAILGVLGDEEAAAFQSAEQEWLRERDVTARQAAGRFAGGAMEELEYTASLAVTTRERAYALLDGYGSVLPREETQSAAG